MNDSRSVTPSASPSGSPASSPSNSRRGSSDDIGYIPPAPTGGDIPTSYEGLLYHYTKLYNLYSSQQQLTVAPPAMNTNYSSHKANEDESLFYSHEPEPSAFRSEHQPPGMTKDSNGTCVIEHLNVIGSDDPNLRITPTDRVLGEGNFGVVQESSYHLAQVAVKRLKRNVSDSALDEFVHETLMNVYALELCSLTRFAFVTVSV